MLFKSNPKLVAIVFICAALAGCATSRSEISLDDPTKSINTAAVASGQTVIIRHIKDERVFEHAPKDPSTPSLGFEGANNASEELKARAVGRKRNAYGKALGDILLQDGQTVESEIRKNLSAALTQAGYRIETENAGSPDVLTIDVYIKKFWAWLQPGFWAIKLNTDIATDLQLSGAVTPNTISVHTEESRQIATDSAWIEIIGQALTDYREQVIKEAASFLNNN